MRQSKKKMNVMMINLINNSGIWLGSQKGQMIIEYVVVFTVIVAVIIFAATAFIKPSVNKLFQDTATAINHIGDNFVAGAYSW